jgi:hypothetical protein
LVVDSLNNHLLEKPDVALAYLYFDQQTQNQLSPIVVIGSLCKQLLESMTNIPHSVKEIYNRQSTKGRCDLASVKSIFLNACSEYSQVYLLLDALDECEEKTFRKEIINFLNLLKTRSDLRIFATSRYHPIDIQNAFSQNLQLKIEANDSDLRCYVSSIIENDMMADMIDEEFKEQIIDRVIRSAQRL